MGALPNRTGPLPPRPAIVSAPRLPKSPRARWLRWTILAAIAAALVFAGAAWRSRLQNAITYETVPVERGDVQAKVTATGNLNAVINVLVSSQVSGNIKALYADWNSKVKKGQLVAVIDPQIFQAQLDQADAVFRSAHSATITTQAQVEKANSDVSSAVAGERNAEAVAAKNVANEMNAKAQWERAGNLLRDGIMSQQDYDSAKAAYDASQAQARADQAQIDAAKQNIATAQAQVRVAQSQLASAQAQELQTQAARRQSQINLDHTRIMAPVDGTVIARRMDVGQTVAASLNPPIIFEIAQDLTKMQVDTNVDESDIGSVSLGQKASFTVDSYPSTTFQGTVADVRKAPIIAQNVVTYDVVISVDNSNFKLFPGMTANVTIRTAKLENTLKVPNSVLRFRPSASLQKSAGLTPVQPDKQQIYVLRDGKLKGVGVAFGLTDGRYTAVTGSDLLLGDRAVLRATSANSASAPSPTPMPGMPRT